MQPRRPQGQRAPPRLTTMWPISPGGAAPEPGLAVEDEAAADARAPEDAEDRAEGLARAEPELRRRSPTRTSLPSCTGAPSSSARLSPSAKVPSQPGRLRALATVPASASTAPGEPTPTPVERGGLDARGLRRPRASPPPSPPTRRPGRPRRGRACACCAEHLVRSSTTTAWIFVPPRSMPPRMRQYLPVVDVRTLLCRACRYRNAATPRGARCGRGAPRSAPPARRG